MIHRLRVCSAVAFCTIVGCTNQERLRNEQLARILTQPANEVVSDVQIMVAGPDGVGVRPTTVPLQRAISVRGTFRTTGEAASFGFVPSAITVALVQKNRDGFFVNCGTCNCDVSGSLGDFEFHGVIKALERPGSYLLRASYKGEVVAEVPVALQ
jgi:hypothetical protein